MCIKNNVEIAHEVLSGLWGNGEERKRKLTESGYNYSAVQSIVNALVNDSVDESIESVENNERLLTVEFDYSKYDGIEIIFSGGD